MADGSTEIKFAEYSDPDLPDLLRVQVLSFLRIVWPDGFRGPNQFRDWTSHRRFQPHHLLYAADSQLVSHLELVSATAQVNDLSYRVLSPTAVLTYPAFRGQGWASRLNLAALDRVDRSDADIGVLTCSPQLVGFYEKVGWSPAREAVVVAGSGSSTWVSEDQLLTRSTGPRSTEFLAALRDNPMRVEDEW